MKLDDIGRFTDRILTAQPRHWAGAGFLAQARTQSNDGRQASRSDRGRFNPQVDLLGALVELFLLGCATGAEESKATVSYIRSHLYDPRGAGGGGRSWGSTSCGGARG